MSNTIEFFKVEIKCKYCTTSKAKIWNVFKWKIKWLNMQSYYVWIFFSIVWIFFGKSIFFIEINERAYDKGDPNGISVILKMSLYMFEQFSTLYLATIMHFSTKVIFHQIEHQWAIIMKKHSLTWVNTLLI